MRNLNLSFFNDINEDDKILLNHVGDWVHLANNKYIVKYSFFLNEKQAVLCRKLFDSMKFDNYKFHGGYDRAERKVLSVFSESAIPENSDFPITPLDFTYRATDKLSHRDFLGSLMSLNISRDTIGDIIVGEGCTVVFVYNTVLQTIIDNITKIGKVGVNISQRTYSDVIKSESFLEIEGTVASLRLDCIISLALHISREKARNVILSKSVSVNYFEVCRPDFCLKENDKFSVRGYGKFVFESVNGMSKKDRFHITLKKYV